MVRRRKCFEKDLKKPVANTVAYSSASGHRCQQNLVRKMLKDTRRLEYKSIGAASLPRESQALSQLRKRHRKQLFPSTTTSITTCTMRRTEIFSLLAHPKWSRCNLFSSTPKRKASIFHQQTKKAQGHWGSLFFHSGRKRGSLEHKSPRQRLTAGLLIARALASPVIKQAKWKHQLPRETKRHPSLLPTFHTNPVFVFINLAFFHLPFTFFLLMLSTFLLSRKLYWLALHFIVSLYLGA